MVDDLDNYRDTKVSKGFSALGEQNADKPAMDSQEEYIFELIKRELKRNAAGYQTEEDKKAGKKPPTIDKVFLTWRDTLTGNLIIQSEKISTLYWGNQNGSMKSGVLQFLEDIGMPQAKDQIPAWGSTFIISMKIRARVIPRIKNNEIVPHEYLFKGGSFRKYSAP